MTSTPQRDTIGTSASGSIDPPVLRAASGGFANQVFCQGPFHLILVEGVDTISRGMTMRIVWVGLLVSVALCSAAQARDTEYKLKIDEVLQNPEYRGKLGDTVAFYFGNQPAPHVGKSFGEFVTNKKTNSFGKPDEEACRWVMLSALLELRDRAWKMGGNAVTNIVSYFKKDTASSESVYECHAGAFVAGVALRGTVVKLGN
jgi:hypothetical protein